MGRYGLNTIFKMGSRLWRYNHVVQLAFTSLYIYDHAIPINYCDEVHCQLRLKIHVCFFTNICTNILGGMFYLYE